MANKNSTEDILAKYGLDARGEKAPAQSNKGKSTGGTDDILKKYGIDSYGNKSGDTSTAYMDALNAAMNQTGPTAKEKREKREARAAAKAAEEKPDYIGALKEAGGDSKIAPPQPSSGDIAQPKDEKVYAPELYTMLGIPQKYWAPVPFKTGDGAGTAPPSFYGDARVPDLPEELWNKLTAEQQTQLQSAQPNNTKGLTVQQTAPEQPKAAPQSRVVDGLRNGPSARARRGEAAAAPAVQPKAAEKTTAEALSEYEEAAQAYVADKTGANEDKMRAAWEEYNKALEREEKAYYDFDIPDEVYLDGTIAVGNKRLDAMKKELERLQNEANTIVFESNGAYGQEEMRAADEMRARIKAFEKQLNAMKKEARLSNEEEAALQKELAGLKAKEFNSSLTAAEQARVNEIELALANDSDTALGRAADTLGGTVMEYGGSLMGTVSTINDALNSLQLTDEEKADPAYVEAKTASDRARAAAEEAYNAYERGEISEEEWDAAERAQEEAWMNFLNTATGIAQRRETWSRNAAQSLTERGQELTGAALQNTTRAENIGVQVGKSVVEMLMDQSIAEYSALGLGGKGVKNWLNFGRETWEKIGDTGLNIMMARVFGSSAMESAAEGRGLIDQIVKAGADAINERVSEMMSGANLVYGRGSLDDLTDALKYSLSNTWEDRLIFGALFGGAGEAGEEIYSAVAGKVTDMLVNPESIDYYFNTPKGQQELAEECKEAALSAFIIGAFGGGVGEASEYLAWRNSEEGQEFLKAVEEAGGDPEAVAEIIDEAAEKMAAEEAETEEAPAEEEMSAGEAAQAAQEAEQNAQEAEQGEPKGSPVGETVKDREMNVRPDEEMSAGEAAQRAAEEEQGGIERVADFSQLRQEDIAAELDKSIDESGGVAGEYLINIVDNGDGTSTVGVSDTRTGLYEEKTARAGHENEAAAQLIYENERKNEDGNKAQGRTAESNAESGKRGNRDSADGQGKTGAERIRRVSQHDTADERRNNAEIYSDEYSGISTEGLIDTGSKNDFVRIIPEAHYDEELKGLADSVEERTGRRPTFILGELILEVNEDGTAARRAGGYFENGQIIVQADHPRKTATQIIDHELFHGMAPKDSALESDTMGLIRKMLKPKELQKIVDKYAKMYAFMINSEGTYQDENGSTTKEAADYVANEICADFYAGIEKPFIGVTLRHDVSQRVRELVDHYGEEVQEAELPSVEEPTAGQTAAEEQQRTGPPEEEELKPAELAKVEEEPQTRAAGMDFFNQQEDGKQESVNLLDMLSDENRLKPISLERVTESGNEEAEEAPNLRGLIQNRNRLRPIGLERLNTEAEDTTEEVPDLKRMAPRGEENSEEVKGEELAEIDEPVPAKAETEQAKKEIKKALTLPVQKSNAEALTIGLESGELTADMLTFSGTVSGLNAEQRYVLADELIKGLETPRSETHVKVPYDGQFTIVNTKENVATVLTNIGAKVMQEAEITKAIDGWIKKADGKAVFEINGQNYLSDGAAAIAISPQSAEYAQSSEGYNAKLSPNGARLAGMLQGGEQITEQPEKASYGTGKSKKSAIVFKTAGREMIVGESYVKLLDGAGVTFMANAETRSIRAINPDGSVKGFVLEMGNAKVYDRIPTKLKALEEQKAAKKSGSKVIQPEAPAAVEATVQAEPEQTESAPAEKKAAKKPSAKQTERLEDFGEKIGGARKDLWRKRGLDIGDLTEMNEAERGKYVKKENVWPKADYQAMVDSGTEIEAAYFIKKVRDALPTAPQARYTDAANGISIEQRQEEYIDFIKTFREGLEKIKSFDDVQTFIDDVLVKNGWAKRDTDYRGRPEVISTGAWKINPNMTTDIVDAVRSGMDKRRLIGEMAKKQFLVAKEMKIPAGYEVHLEDGKGWSSKGVKVGTYFVTKGHVIIQTGFESRESAIKYLQDLAAKKKGGKSKFVPRQLESIHRTGRDVRENNTKHVDGEDLMSTFHFRGGEFGNWTSAKDRQVSMDYAYDALTDLADLLGIDPADVSLGGELAIAFGARGTAGAAAHYEPDRRVINLTKMKGAGSLGHEWAHALDNIIGQQLGAKSYMTEETRKVKLESLSKLMDAMKYKQASAETAAAAAEKDINRYRNNLRSWISSEFSGRFQQNATQTQMDRLKALMEEGLSGTGDYSDWFYNDTVGIVGKLSELRKEVTGRGLQKEDRKKLAGWLYQLGQKVKAAENPTAKEMTDFYKGSKRFDEIHSKADKGYWSSDVEMFARAFACYLNDKAAAIDTLSDYLSGHSENAVSIDFDKNGEPVVVKAIPDGDERLYLNQLFDELIAELKEKGMLHVPEAEPENYSVARYSLNESETDIDDNTEQEYPAELRERILRAVEMYERREPNSFIAKETGLIVRGNGARVQDWDTNEVYDVDRARGERNAGTGSEQTDELAQKVPESGIPGNDRGRAEEGYTEGLGGERPHRPEYETLTKRQKKSLVTALNREFLKSAEETAKQHRDYAAEIEEFYIKADIESLAEELYRAYVNGEAALGDKLSRHFNYTRLAKAFDKIAKYDGPRYSLNDDEYIPEEADAEYAAAETEEQKQAVIDKAAANWGAVLDDEGRPERFYHGTPKYGFTEFKDGNRQGVIWVTPVREYAEEYTRENGRLGVMLRGDKKDASKVYELAMRYDNLFDLGDINDGIFRYGTRELEENTARIAEALGLEDYYIDDMFEGYFYPSLWELTKTPEFKQALIDAGYDAVKAKEFGKETYGVVNSNQLKSLEPVTKTKLGRVIKPSERFSDSKDIRFSLNDDGETLEQTLDRVYNAKTAKKAPRGTVKANRDDMLQRLQNKDFKSVVKDIAEQTGRKPNDIWREFADHIWPERGETVRRAEGEYENRKQEYAEREAEKAAQREAEKAARREAEAAERENAPAESETEPRAEARSNDRDEFIGTTEHLDKLGVKIAGSEGIYDNLEMLKQAAKAEKINKREIERLEERLEPTDAEKKFARGIAEGTYSADEIPASMDADVVEELADQYFAAQSYGTTLLTRRKADVNRQLDDKMQATLEGVKKLDKSKLKKAMETLSLNYNTPLRNMRGLFGDKAGERIHDVIFAPVAQNSAERERFRGRMYDAVREFEGENGKKRKLTKAESALVQQVIEYRAVGEAVAAMEMSKDNVKKREASIIRAAAEKIAAGEDPISVLNEYASDGELRKLADHLAAWNNVQEMLASGQVDTVKINNAVAAYSEQFNKFYDAINDVLTAHGYEPIGFIKGYAPHMQEEHSQNMLKNALSKMGVNEDVTNLPTEIAGLTGQYRPNKRWNPHFLERHGDKTNYDIVTAYETYVDYMSDVIYHIDDIMRVRAMERWFRGEYSDDNTKQTIVDAKKLIGQKLEKKLDFLRSINKVQPGEEVSNRMADDMIREYIKERYADFAENSDHGPLVMWLSDYANKLAAKQLSFDRAMEYFAGRKALNIANKLTRAFGSAQVGAKISSMFNQGAQLPMIYAELGGRDTLRAMRDFAFGGLRKNGWYESSDFLTIKRGVDGLAPTLDDMIIDKMFLGAEFMDNLMSTIAVRGKYLKEIRSGADPKTAMKRADRFGSDIMGDRTRGVKPLAFEAKSPILRMLNMFQIEALNSYEHVIKDLPHDFRDIERAHGGGAKGKVAASAAIASVVIKALLAAFTLNRIDDELYGGTPAPFDIIGLTANFIASGNGMRTNDMMATLINDMWRRAFDEDLFEDVPYSERMSDGEFKWGAAAGAAAEDVVNDLPMVRNLAALLGIGDNSLPYAGSNIKDIIDKINGDSQKPWDLLLRNFVLGLIPGGGQVSKTWQGLETLAAGGDYTSKGKLRYAIDNKDPMTIARLALFGKYSTPESQRYYADLDYQGKMSNSMSDAQQRGFDIMTEAGVKKTEAEQMIREMWDAAKAASVTKEGKPSSTINQEGAKKALDELDASRQTKAILWQCMNSGWKAKNNPYDTRIGQMVYDYFHAEGDDIPALSLPRLD